MLPDGFEWRPYIDGPALYLGGRAIAMCAPLGNGRFRVDFVLRRHSEFFDSEQAVVRYVEAWAAKWDTRIREEAGRVEVRGW